MSWLGRSSRSIIVLAATLCASSVISSARAAPPPVETSTEREATDDGQPPSPEFPRPTTPGSAEAEERARDQDQKTERTDQSPPERARRARSEGVLGRHTRTLEEKWSQRGTTTKLPPRLLERGDQVAVYVPQSDLERPGCSTVVALGPPNLSFVFRFRAQRGAPPQNWPVPSSAGMAEVTRCGDRRGSLRDLVLQMRSPRGVVQLLTLSSSEPPPQAEKLLPSRDAGASLPSPRVGPRPRLGPLERRVNIRRARYEGYEASAVRERSIATNAEGRATTVLFFDPGCHRLDFLSEHAEKKPVDVDAQLATLEGASIIASDESASADASLTLCLGRPERYRLALRGAAPGTAVAAVHAEWHLPEALPLEWGPRARANLAEPLMSLGLLDLEQRPVASALGVQGVTRIAIEVDPNACYAVSMAAIRGIAQRLGLAAEAGAVLREAQVDTGRQSAGLTFCAQGAGHATIETHNAGQGLAWLLGVWEINP